MIIITIKKQKINWGAILLYFQRTKVLFFSFWFVTIASLARGVGCMGAGMCSPILQSSHFEHVKSKDFLGDTLPFTSEIISTFKS